MSEWVRGRRKHKNSIDFAYFFSTPSIHLPSRSLYIAFLLLMFLKIPGVNDKSFMWELAKERVRERESGRKREGGVRNLFELEKHFEFGMDEWEAERAKRSFKVKSTECLLNSKRAFFLWMGEWESFHCLGMTKWVDASSAAMRLRLFFSVKAKINFFFLSMSIHWKERLNYSRVSTSVN